MDMRRLITTSAGVLLLVWLLLGGASGAPLPGLACGGESGASVFCGIHQPAPSAGATQVTTEWSLAQNGWRMDDRVILAGLADSGSGPPARLSLSAVIVQMTWFGPMWELRLESSTGVLAAELGGQSDPVFPPRRYVPLARGTTLFTERDIYTSTLAYDPDTGEIAVAVRDLTADAPVFSGFYYGAGGTGAFFAAAGTLGVAEEQAKAAFAIRRLERAAGFQRTGSAIALADFQYKIQKYEVNWSDEQPVLRLTRSSSRLPGEYEILIHDFPAGREVGRIRVPASAGEVAVRPALRAYPPGVYRASLAYVEPGYTQDLGRLGWQVVAPRITADVQVPVAADLLPAAALPPLRGEVRLESSQPVDAVQVHLVSGEGTVLLDEVIASLPAGERLIPFTYEAPPAATSAVSDRFALTVAGPPSFPLEAVRMQKEWRPIEVSLRFSGGGAAVLINTLVEMAISLDATAPADLAGREMEVLFTTPGGAHIQRMARQAFRVDHPHTWGVALAPAEAGTWAYEVTLKTPDTAERLSLTTGSFAVYALAQSAVSVAPASRPQPPFKVLYNNDTTNIQYQPSAPYQTENVADLLRATVAEVAGTGVDAHFLSPSYTWVPWWQSDFYPMREHQAWFAHKYGSQMAAGDAITNYVLQGGDLVSVFLASARQNGQAAFISLRLNDQHSLDRIDEDVRPETIRYESRFYDEHPEFRLGADQELREQRVLNWLVPEVRGRVLSLIHELVEKYDLDGLELDFMRHPVFFPDDTPLAVRQEIMTGFVRQVRQMLDATAPPGTYRWLAARIPAYEGYHPIIGLDLPAVAAAGIDMFILSTSFHTEQQSDYAHIKQEVPDSAVYLEMTYTTSVGLSREDLGWSGTARGLTTDEQFYTTAHLAYARGLAGVSLFNFVYYRNTLEKKPGGFFSEPPFHVLAHLGDPIWVARQPQHYFLERVANDEIFLGANFGWLSLRRYRIGKGESLNLDLDMAPPAGGWTQDGRMRLHVIRLRPGSVWQVKLNGILLERVDDVADLYPNPYPDGFGVPQEYMAWRVPVQAVREGINHVEITLVDGPAAAITYLDLAVR